LGAAASLETVIGGNVDSGFFHYLTLPYLLGGAAIALQIWALSFVCASIFGMALALVRNSRHFFILRAIVGAYIWLLRGTPILLQLLIWYNVLPIIGYRINEFWTAVLALSVCFSAYMCEVFRGGLLAVHEGQVDAAHSLGFGPIRTHWYFVIPQALRVSMPSIVNFAILMLKDTSITSVIAVAELTLRSNIIVARNFEYIPVFGASLTIYLILTSVLTLLQQRLEKMFDYSRREAVMARKALEIIPRRSGNKLGDYLCPTDVQTDNRAVVLDKVTKSYGKNKVLDNINLTFRSFRTTCVMGPSGSGKSTLLRTINGLETIDSGNITVNGVAMGGHSTGGLFGRTFAPFKVAKARIRARTATVFQQFHLFQNYSTIENITLAPRKINGMDAATADAEGQNLLELLKLGHLRNRMPQRLSGGEQQRIGILRALAVKPKTLLFDEPTSALDPERVGEVLDVMMELSEAGGTMIVVTHEIEFARRCADWVVFMEDGRIVEEGPPEKILENPDSERIRIFLAGIGGMRATAQASADATSDYGAGPLD
jgi:polar amino acid transport system permease protein